MGSMILGTKPEAFHFHGNTWLCTTGLPSDAIIEVGETLFHLHKFPLMSRSGVLENLVGELSGENDKKCVLQLHNIPGGAKSFLLVAKFCYGIKIELTSLNVVSLRCAAEYLGMNEDYGEDNLISKTEKFLNIVFGNWDDSIKALKTCEEVLTQAEELHIVSRCINSLAMKAGTDPSLFSWPVSRYSDAQSPAGTTAWNGLHNVPKPISVSGEWWYEDVSFLRLPLYKKMIKSVQATGIKPEKVVGSIMFYAYKYLPLLGRHSCLQNGNRAVLGQASSSTSEADQRTLLQAIVELLPDENGVTPANFMLRLLRTSMLLHADQSCRENLEKRIGAQLDQVALEDILIPNMGYSAETLYDIDSVQRMLDQFLLLEQDSIDSTSAFMVEAEQLMEEESQSPMTVVANLVDGYLAEVAPDVNLPPIKFQSLAAGIPDYARPLDDGLYRAIDIYLKAHPWLIDSEREQICRLMNCQKLSVEASTHAAQNERLPLRVIVQILFFEQLRLRTSVAGWMFLSNNLDDPKLVDMDLALSQNCLPAQEVASEEDRVVSGDKNSKEHFSELEKKCMNTKQELEKLVSAKGSWNAFCRRFGFRMKMRLCDTKAGRDFKVPRPSRAAAKRTFEWKTARGSSEL